MAAEDKADQIIVIGDAPANLHSDIMKHAKRFKDQKTNSGWIYPVLESV